MTDFLSDRASDAVEFLQNLGLADGVNEDDLLSSSSGRAPLRECVASLAVALVGASSAARHARRRQGKSNASSSPWSSASTSSYSYSPALASAAARLRAAARDPSRPGKHIDECLWGLEEAAERVELEEEEEQEVAATTATATNNSKPKSEEAKTSPPPVTPPRLDLIERLSARVAAARLECLRSRSSFPEGGVGEPMEQDETEEDKKKKKQQQQQQPTPSSSLSPAETAAASAALRRLGRLLGCGDASSDDRALPLASASASAAASISAALPEGLEQALVLDKGLFFGSDGGKERLEKLQEVDAALREEYRLRRRLLAGRARVTLRALLSSPKLLKAAASTEADGGGEGKARCVLSEATAEAEAALARMRDEPSVSPVVAELSREGSGRAEGGIWEITAGHVLSFGAKTCSPRSISSSPSSPSSAAPAPTASVKRVVVAPVPDRGGRVNEGGRRGGGGGAGPAWTPRVSGGGGGGGGWRHKKKHKK